MAQSGSLAGCSFSNLPRGRQAEAPPHQSRGLVVRWYVAAIMVIKLLLVAVVIGSFAAECCQGLPAAPCGRRGALRGQIPEIPTPTARRRFRQRGYKGSQSIEEAKAVILRCLAGQSEAGVKSYRRVKVRGRAARERHGGAEPQCPCRVARDKGYTYICGLPWGRPGWRERRRFDWPPILEVTFCLVRFR